MKELHTFEVSTSLLNSPEIGQHVQKMEWETEKDTDKHHGFINSFLWETQLEMEVKSRGILANTSLKLKSNAKKVIL